MIFTVLAPRLIQSISRNVHNDNNRDLKRLWQGNLVSSVGYKDFESHLVTQLKLQLVTQIGWYICMLSHYKTGQTAHICLTKRGWLGYAQVLFSGVESSYEIFCKLNNKRLFQFAKSCGISIAILSGLDLWRLCDILTLLCLDKSSEQ